MGDADVGQPFDGRRRAGDDEVLDVAEPTDAADPSTGGVVDADASTHVARRGEPHCADRAPHPAQLDQLLDPLGTGDAAIGERGIIELVMATHAGVTTDAFAAIVRDWIAKAKHPKFDRPYTELVYQPMLEVIDYLQANDFKTFIVSGGGIEFMRPWTETVYGIPPEQVVGSSIKTEYKVVDGTPVLMREAAIDFIDDKAGKPVGINSHIGRRPIAAFGNSAGDREMLEWTGAGEGATLKVLVFHDDADREYAYGPADGQPDTKIGTFPQDLMDEAKQKGWNVISMRDDWAKVFPE